MNYLESAKQYTGNDVEKIFFRPILTGQGAQELGVRVLYNMPVPTIVQMWDGNRLALKKFADNGWTGGAPAKKYQKQIPMERVKAEMGFSAADYFSLVYELISARADVNMQDLTGTTLEQAETELFKQNIAESWPNSLDDSCAREEWGWKPQWDLSSMTDDMIAAIRKKNL